MAQTIALSTRAPQVSLADVVDRVNRARMDELKLEGMARDNEMGAVTHQQSMNKANALDQYRTRAGAKDPEALSALDAYPEEQKKLFDAFDGMSPQEYMEAAKKANAFGEAARRVQAFAQGTPQQKQAWDRELDRLTAEGFIDEESRDLWKGQGPSPEIINEALTIAEYTKTYKGKNAALDKAKVDDVRNRIDTRNALADARIDDIGYDNELATRRTDAQIEQGGMRASATAQNADSLEAYRQAEVDRKTKQGDESNAIKAQKKQGGGAAPGGTGLSENERGRRIRDIEKRIAAMQEDGSYAPEQIAEERKSLRKAYEVEARGTADDPIAVMTPAEAAKLPAGTYFLTPDGRTIRKK